MLALPNHQMVVIISRGSFGAFFMFGHNFEVIDKHNDKNSRIAFVLELKAGVGQLKVLSLSVNSLVNIARIPKTLS